MSKRVEEPSYSVVRRIGPVEVRTYAPTVEAVTDVEGELERVQSEGFRRLAAYIFGGNHRRQAIAMTAPVATRPRGVAHRVSFTMPSEMTLESLPPPNDSRVTLVPVPARTVAVLRFSGFSGHARFEHEKAALLRALAGAGLEVIGPVTLARYDPPWTLPFLRRNELLVELAGPVMTAAASSS